VRNGVQSIAKFNVNNISLDKNLVSVQVAFVWSGMYTLTKKLQLKSKPTSNQHSLKYWQGLVQPSFAHCNLQ